jgi:hypothetical protein
MQISRTQEILSQFRQDNLLRTISVSKVELMLYVYKKKDTF